MKKNALLTFVVLVVAFTATSATADAVDDYVRAQLERQHIPGVTVAVVKNGKPVKLQGYGFANLELNTPSAADTVYRIGSVSKQFLATAILLLEKDGRLSLDDKATKYLDGAPEIWSDITIRHLLTHTSGLVREGPAFAALKMQSDAEVIKSAYTVPLVFKTGERWQYSNLGYFIVAEIIAKTSGKPWPEFVSERIFKPLSMDSSRTVDVTPIVPHRASGYVYRDERYQNAGTLLALRPSGAFMSSAVDLIKWNAALDNATLLSQKALDAMWTKVLLNDGKSSSYGFGFELSALGGHRAMAHGGSTPGFRSYYLRLPDDKLSVIVLTNNEYAASDALAVGIAALYIKDLFPPGRAVQLSPAALDTLAGRYRFQQGVTVAITKEGGGLHARAPMVGIDVQLVPESPTSFFSPDDPRMRFVFAASPGAPTQVKVKIGDNEPNGGTKE